MDSDGGVADAVPRSGRPFDRSSDDTILESALELLAERDYAGLTLDEIATRTRRAKTTLYRRWSTKEELVLAAIRFAGRPPELDRLPDRGSLRADLLAVVDSPWLGGPERRIAVLGGLTAAGRQSPRLAAAIRAEITEPYSDIYRRLLERAVERGELADPGGRRISILAAVVPAMSTHELGSGRVDRDFYISVIDEVVLAALR